MKRLMLLVLAVAALGMVAGCHAEGDVDKPHGGASTSIGMFR